MVPPVLLPSAIPVTTTTLLLPPAHPTLFLPNSLFPIWTSPTNYNHNQNTILVRTPPPPNHHHLLFHHLFFLHLIYICPLLPLSCCLNPLVLSHSLRPSSPLLPPWYCGLPVDLAACGLRTCPDSTPLSSTPLRLFSPVPCSLPPFGPLTRCSPCCL